MENRKSSTFNQHCFSVFSNVPSQLVKTFAADRGKEFSGYNEMEKELGIDVYFADAYGNYFVIVLYL